MTAIQAHFSKALILALAGALAAYGATAERNRSRGGKGAAVVYIDAIPAKHFRHRTNISSRTKSRFCSSRTSSWSWLARRWTS